METSSGVAACSLVLKRHPYLNDFFVRCGVVEDFLLIRFCLSVDKMPSRTIKMGRKSIFLLSGFR